MNYFEKCKKRIENAKNIDGDCIRTFSLIKKYVIDEELVLREFTHPDLKIYYSITFKEIKIPISENEIKYLFELSVKKLNELTNIENEKILREL